jgi:hypothetical protein
VQHGDRSGQDDIPVTAARGGGALRDYDRKNMEEGWY